MVNNTKIDNLRLDEALKHLNIYHKKFDIKLENSNNFFIEKKSEKYIIKYTKTCEAFRGLSLLKRYINKDDFIICQKNKFENLGYMVDAARNAVPKISSLKRLALKLALLGYTKMYIYVEDAMEIENEPYFGYLRGRYTREELKELDNYCLTLGLELVPCLQTLAHLSCIFRWKEYQNIRDNSDILLIGEERTYKLIDNMFNEVLNTFTTREIHIGLDEAHFVGLGRYLDLYGFQNRFEIMKKHIEKILQIAEKYSLKLEMWCDMFFRLAFSGAYIVENKKFNKDILDVIPKNIKLVYWDYGSKKSAIYDNMIENLKMTGNEVAFAGGTWKWTGFNPLNRTSIEIAKTALDSCEKNGIREVFATAWADNGAEASLFSTIPAVVAYSEFCYDSNPDENINEMLKAVYNVTLKDFLTLDINIPVEGKDSLDLGGVSKILLYNDPLCGAMDAVIEHLDIKNNLISIKNSITNAKKNQTDYIYIFELIEMLCEININKWDLSLRIKKYYDENNVLILKDIANIEIPLIIKNIKKFYKIFRQNWEYENKANGFEIHDIRLGGLIQRLENCKRIINNFVTKKISVIDELIQDRLSIPKQDAFELLLNYNWAYVYTVNVI